MRPFGDLYDVVLVLHILAAIVGFGGVFWNGVYGFQARSRRGPEGLAIAQANFFVSTKFAIKAVYAVFLFGILLVLLSDDTWEFSDTWVWTSMAIYVLALGLSHGVLQPTAKKMLALSEQVVSGEVQPASAGPQLEAYGKKLGVIGPALNLAMIVVLVLMVWKPGV